MDSPDSQQYAFFINNEVKGPVSRNEIEALIATGDIGPDTPCALVGGTGEWEPSSKHFPFAPKNPRPQTQPTAAAPTEEDRPGLDSKLRQKIIRLGLATAATIDDFTPAQAIAAVESYEAQRRKDRRTLLFGGIGTGIAVFVAGLVFLSTGPGESVTGAVVGKFVKPSEQFTKQQSLISGELRNVNRAWDELYETTLKAPEGREGRSFFESRVYVSPRASSELRFHADTSRLAELSPEKPRIVYLKQLQPDIRKEMVRQAKLVWKYKHADTLEYKLDETELAASFELLRKQAGDKLTSFVKENELASVKNPDEEELRIEGARAENLVGILVVNGFSVFFPYAGKDKEGQDFLVFSEPKSHRVTREEALETERYTVTEKQKIGGNPYGIRVNFAGKSYFISRLTPNWYYLGVARTGFDQNPAWVGVSAEEYERTEIGAVLPTKKLFDYSYFITPSESLLTGSLTLQRPEQ
ncbi:MAG: DUF4339 domain-containing protein [Puniceicoccales bacterium]|jgi:hypothetical protein|nr:DUF4339 domain-containing protein [Puniceicoccales bacterium]